MADCRTRSVKDSRSYSYIPLAIWQIYHNTDRASGTIMLVGQMSLLKSKHRSGSTADSPDIMGGDTRALISQCCLLSDTMMLASAFTHASNCLPRRLYERSLQPSMVEFQIRTLTDSSHRFDNSTYRTQRLTFTNCNSIQTTCQPANLRESSTTPGKSSKRFQKLWISSTDGSPLSMTEQPKSVCKKREILFDGHQPNATKS